MSCKYIARFETVVFIVLIFRYCTNSNNIERVFLTYLQWDVSVNCSEFAKTYFHLRDIEHMMEQW